MRAFYVLFLLSILSLKSFAQKEAVQAAKLKTIYYTFSGISSKEEAENLDARILKIANVKVSKTEFKPEKKGGQLRVQYAEQVITSESEAQNKVEIEELLKKTLIEMGYSPMEMKEIQ